MEVLDAQSKWTQVLRFPNYAKIGFTGKTWIYISRNYYEFIHRLRLLNQFVDNVAVGQTWFILPENDEFIRSRIMNGLWIKKSL